MKHELYLNEDGTKYAVLVSYGFGAGWSSWNKPWFAYDKRIVEFWLAHKDDDNWIKTCDRYFSPGFHEESPAHKEVREFFTNVIGFDDDECPYMGGFIDIRLQWMDFNTPWRITEYDGAESIECLGDINWICFSKE